MTNRTVRLLLTGFGPFPGAPVNPTMTLIRHFARRRGLPEGLSLSTALLPVDWRRTAHRTARLIERLLPDAVLMTGLAARAQRIRVEFVAVNAAGPHPDATGLLPDPGPPCDGPPMRTVGAAGESVLAALLAAGIDAERSDDAGRYLCNAAYFTALGSNRPVVFLHMPMTEGTVLRHATLAALRCLAEGQAAAR